MFGDIWEVVLRGYLVWCGILGFCIRFSDFRSFRWLRWSVDLGARRMGGASMDFGADDFLLFGVLLLGFYDSAV